MLLRQPSVRKELKVSDKEADKIEAHCSQQWKKAKDAAKLSELERDRKFTEMSQENERFIEQTLTAQQRKRLQEIELQVAGLVCVTRPEIASKLKLTAEQKKRAHQYQMESRRELEDHMYADKDSVKRDQLQELKKTSRK